MHSANGNGQHIMPDPSFHPAIRFVARVISVIFHPLFIPVYISWFLMYNTPLFAGLTSTDKGIAATSFFCDVHGVSPCYYFTRKRFRLCTIYLPAHTKRSHYTLCGLWHVLFLDVVRAAQPIAVSGRICDVKSGHFYCVQSGVDHEQLFKDQHAWHFIGCNGCLCLHSCFLICCKFWSLYFHSVANCRRCLHGTPYQLRSQSV